MIIIGVTGTIGSGKTFALNFFKSKNIKIFSADEEVKKLLKTNVVKKKVFKLFPEAFLKKKLNRNALANIVFNNKKNLKKLEKIIHPYVGKNKQKFLVRNKKKKLIVMEIPILFEKKTEKNYDYIILMSINKKIQKQRVLDRKNMTVSLFNKILSNQISNKKKKYADFVVNNNGTKDKTREKLKKIIDKIISTTL